MSRSRLMLGLLLAGASAFTLAQARAATAPPAAPAQPAQPALPLPGSTPGVSLDLSGIPVTNVAGVWEVAHELDNGRTIYTHLRIKQQGTQLSGDWLDTNGRAYPLTGSVDGNHLKVQIQGPNGAFSAQAEVDPPANMVGMFVEPDGKHVIFTANDQAKYTPAPESGEGAEGGVGGEGPEGSSIPH